MTTLLRILSNVSQTALGGGLRGLGSGGGGGGEGAHWQQQLGDRGALCAMINPPYTRPPQSSVCQRGIYHHRLKVKKEKLMQPKVL